MKMKTKLVFLRGITESESSLLLSKFAHTIEICLGFAIVSDNDKNQETHIKNDNKHKYKQGKTEA